MTDFGNSDQNTYKRHAAPVEALRYAEKATAVVGTPPYADHFFLGQGRYLPTSDVLALGATVLELISHETIEAYLERMATQAMKDCLVDQQTGERLPIGFLVLNPNNGPLLQQLAEQTPMDAKLKRVMLRSLSLDPAERPRDMREFLHDLGTQRLYWHRDLDGLVTIDFQWLESFPQELRSTVSEYIAFVEDTLSNPKSVLNQPLPTVPVFMDGETQPTLDVQGLTLWQQQVNLLRSQRSAIMSAWVTAENQLALRSRLSELLTYCEDLLIDHFIKGNETYAIYPTVDLMNLPFAAPDLPKENRVDFHLASPLDHTVSIDFGERHRVLNVSQYFKWIAGPEPRGCRLYMTSGQIYDIGQDLERELVSFTNFNWLNRTSDVLEAHERISSILKHQAVLTRESDVRLIGIDAVRAEIELAKQAMDWDKVFAVLDTYMWSYYDLDEDHDRLLSQALQSIIDGRIPATSPLAKRPARTKEGHERLEQFAFPLEKAAWSLLNVLHGFVSPQESKFESGVATLVAQFSAVQSVIQAESQAFNTEVEAIEPLEEIE